MIFDESGKYQHRHEVKWSEEVLRARPELVVEVGPSTTVNPQVLVDLANGSLQNTRALFIEPDPDERLKDYADHRAPDYMKFAFTSIKDLLNRQENLKGQADKVWLANIFTDRRVKDIYIQEILAEALQLLKPGGELIVIEHYGPLPLRGAYESMSSEFDNFFKQISDRYEVIPINGTYNDPFVQSHSHIESGLDDPAENNFFIFKIVRKEKRGQM